MNAFYDIHGLRVRLTGLADAAVPDINGKLHAFTASDDGGAADIEVAIGDFKPNLEGCLALDRRYWARPGYFYLEESDKGLSWRAEIVGLDRDSGATLRVRFAHGPRNRYRMPWCLFPDLVAHLYVLWPLLECELAARGLYLVHAGGVEKNGRATLIAGRGGVNKTAIVAELVRRGWRPMGDDFVLLQRTPAGTTRVRALPTSPRWFEFQLRHMQDEDLSVIDKLRLLRFLYRKKTVGVEFSREADLGKLVLVDQVEGCVAPQAAPLDNRTAAEMLHLNCRMERTAYVGYGTIIGRFLEGHRYVVPESTYGHEWDGLGEALAGLVGGARALRVASPARYMSAVTDMVEEGAAFV
jgi:hypothetical protein